MTLDLVRFDCQLLVLFLNGSHNLCRDLLGDILDVRASLRCANRVHEGDLLEGALAETEDHLPPLSLCLDDLGQLLVLLILQVVVRILHEILAVDVPPAPASSFFKPFWRHKHVGRHLSPPILRCGINVVDAVDDTVA